MIIDKIEMEDDLAELQPEPDDAFDPSEQRDDESEDIVKLRGEFQTRLVVANLRTEAVRAGMVDLDGLKLIDLTAVRLGSEDKVIGGRKLMEDLKRTKPWLFGARSSSSAAIAPASQPVRQKSAMQMTDEEYAAARKVVTKY